MAERAAYDYRAFMIQVSDSLVQKDIESIVYLHQLSPSLAKESPLTVLVQLEMGGITSANNPDDLAKLMKEISRLDLAKKVKDFAKKQRKGRSTHTPLQRLDQSAVNLSASLKLTTIQCRILLEQVENVKEEAEEAGFKRVEEVVAEAHTLISEHLQRKLQYASKLLQDSTVHATQYGRSNERDSPPSSPNSSLDSSLELEAHSSAETVLPMQPPITSQPAAPLQHVNRPPVRYAKESEVKAAAGNLKSQSLPRSKASPTKRNQAAGPSAKQPLVPPQASRLPTSSTGQLTSTGVTARHVQAVVPRSEQGRDEETTPIPTQMVTGKLNSQKPTPPPKPKNKIKRATPQVEINQPDDECVYDDVNTYSSTGTGDSGFGDSKEFLKVSLQGHYAPPQVFNTQAQTSLTQSHSYAPLNVSAVNAGYYKSLRRDGIQEVQYAPQVVPPTVTAPNTHYMNVTKGKK